MKIVSWNLAGGDKRAPLGAFDCDIAALQERRYADVDDRELWVGHRPRRGLSVRVAAGWSVERIDVPRRMPRYFVPAQVSGPESFQMISVWAQPDRPYRYVRGTVRAVERWAKRITAQPTVIAGDFNANACWDGQHPSDRNFTALAARLSELGLVSAYHAFFNEEYACETRPTFFLYRHTDRPFHLDYCFIPRTWLPRLRSVTVGAHEEWGKWSDHMPVSVELASLA